MRDPKVRLRGLSEIATNRWLFLFVLGFALQIGQLGDVPRDPLASSAQR